MPGTPLAGTDHAYADTTVLAGSTYFYRISGLNAVGASAPSTSGAVMTIPATPTLTAGATSATTVHLSWTASFGTATYLLEKSIDSGTHWTTAVTQAATSYDDTALTADTAYEYRVSATDATGSSPTSTVANVTTILASPAGFTVTASTTVSTEIDLAWTAVTHATGYLIERSLNQQLWATVTPATPLVGTDHAYADTTATAGTTFFYRISAINAVGTSVATAARQRLDAARFARAVGGRGIRHANRSLTWTPIDSATTYLVEKSIDTGTHWTTLSTLATTLISDTGLTADTSYEYRVSAINATGNSTPSTVQTLMTLLSAPAGLAATAASATEVDLSWTATTDADDLHDRAFHRQHGVRYADAIAGTGGHCCTVRRHDGGSRHALLLSNLCDQRQRHLRPQRQRDGDHAAGSPDWSCRHRSVEQPDQLELDQRHRCRLVEFPAAKFDRQRALHHVGIRRRRLHVRLRREADHRHAVLLPSDRGQRKRQLFPVDRRNGNDDVRITLDVRSEDACLPLPRSRGRGRVGSALETEN